jgi:hypothetical protein
MSRGRIRQPATWVFLDPENWPRCGPAYTQIDPDAHPVIAAINRIAASVAQILGPLLWAAIIVLLIWAEISTS